MPTILALSGSLRAASVNTALLHAMTELVPAGVTVRLFADMASLPLFNPDLEGFEAAVVHALRRALREADAVVIASPEYAHGVTGVIKNSLDWVVGSGELTDKPVAVLIASTRSEHAPAALRRTLAVMGARVIDDACRAIPLNSSRASLAEIRAMPAVMDALGAVLDVLLAETNIAMQVEASATATPDP